MPHTSMDPTISGSEMDSAGTSPQPGPAGPSSVHDGTSTEDTAADGASRTRLTARPSDLVVKDVAKSRRASRRWSVQVPQGGSLLSILPKKPSAVNTILENEDEEDSDSGMDHGEASLIAPDSEVKLLDDTTRGGDQDDAEAIESDPQLRVLRKPANARTDEDLSFICSETANVKFFRQLEDAKLHMELCRHITFQIVQIDESIFVQGEEGTTFYIIYSGAVKVMVQEKDYIRKNSNDVGSCVCVLEDGDSFGELALLGNGLRAATVMTAMPTQLLRVEKEAYDHSLHRLHEAELEERIRFLQRIFIFSHWNDENLRKLSKVLTRKAFVKNSTVIPQGSNTDHMYFILSGRLRVLKSMDLSQQLTNKLSNTRGGRGVQRLIQDVTNGGGGTGRTAMPRTPMSCATTSGMDSTRRGLGGEGPSSRSGSPPASPRSPPMTARSFASGSASPVGEFPYRHGSSSFRGASHHSPMLELGELNSHQYFGELALLEGRDKGKHKAAVAHSASVVSLSAVEVLLLSKYDFYHLIDQKTVSMMMAYADKFYLDESAIRSQIKEQSKWESYKKDLLREIRPGGASMSSRARGR